VIAVVDARYKFTIIDIGGEGRQSDAGLFSKSMFRAAIDGGFANIPPPGELHGIPVPLPHVIVADEGFGMDTHIMRPYSRSKQLTLKQKIFNYRLSRCVNLYYICGSYILHVMLDETVAVGAQFPSLQRPVSIHRLSKR
jgi:hypothetical protein